MANDSTRPSRSTGRAFAYLGLALLNLLFPLVQTSAPAFVMNSNRTVEDYSKFSHSSENHSRQFCSSCHQRNDDSTTPSFPGHKACTDCHSAQFFTPVVAMCNICHSGLSGSNPPLKAFPSRFNESFNAKFDHAQHNRGEAKPPAGCASCHSASGRRGVAMTIPVGIAAHSNCYKCHTPGKTSSWRGIDSCGTCHSIASYRRTPATAAAFNVSFSHAEHGFRQRLNCADCHSLTEGLPQARQVSSPRAAQHFPPAGGFTCASCHNNKRAFGEKDFDDCTRCHKGATFRHKGRE